VSSKYRQVQPVQEMGILLCFWASPVWTQGFNSVPSLLLDLEVLSTCDHVLPSSLPQGTEGTGQRAATLQALDVQEPITVPLCVKF